MRAEAPLTVVSGPSEGRQRKSLSIFSSRVDNLTGADALDRVVRFASADPGPGARTVYFTNVHTILTLRRDRKLRECLDAADLVLPDGSGLAMAGRACRTPIIANLNGTDFTPRVLANAAERNLSVYLLGAKVDVLDACVCALQERFVGLRIAGWHHGFFSPSENERIIAEINAVRPHIILVALGTPLQERWCHDHAPRLSAGVCLAVGGLFDFLSGDKKRAPHWMRRAGMEWLYRFLQDPGTKWRRVFIETPHFLCLIAFRLVFPAGARERRA